MIRKSISESFTSLKQYCEQEAFSGWDPFDGLNSRVFRSIPLVRDNALARLAWIQAFKRLPVNLRPLLLVGKDHNPKGLGLFLAGYCNLWRLNRGEDHRKRIEELSHLLIEKRSAGWSGACWGYNFDWQARAFFQPRSTPTVVASSFIGHAMLDAAAILGDRGIENIACTVANFVMKDLNRTPDEHGNFAFSYSPLDRTSVFNASLLGSSILARIFSITGDPELKEAAGRSVRFCINHQQSDGSWFYGTLPHHRWIDNFHTGFNLECLAQYARYTGDHSFDDSLDRGFRYYRDTFFTREGMPKYYDNSLYPIDLHATAQLVMTCSRTGQFAENRELIDRALEWAIRNMQSKKGYFYFRRLKWFSNRIPYMRWTQAWMFAAMTEYLLNTANESDS